MDDVRAMLSDAAPEPVKEPEPKPEAAEVEAPKVDAEAKITEPEPATGEKQQPEEDEEELPPNVKKKIAKEVEREAKASRAIAEAISKRKEAEDKLAKLTVDKPGSEPAPTTESKEADGKPIRPKKAAYPTIDSFDGTWAEREAEIAKIDANYDAQLDKYHEERDAWLTARTEKSVEQKLTAQQRQTENKRLFDEAVKVHPELPEMAKAVMAGSTDKFQLAVSELPEWAAITVYLGQHPEDLKSVTEAFEKSPVAAIAQIGALMERTKQAAKPPVSREQAARPPAKVGLGTAPSSKKKLEELPTEEFNDEFKKMIA